MKGTWRLEVSMKDACRILFIPLGTCDTGCIAGARDAATACTLYLPTSSDGSNGGKGHHASCMQRAIDNMQHAFMKWATTRRTTRDVRSPQTARKTTHNADRPYERQHSRQLTH